MPAIRYIYSNTGAILTPTSTGSYGYVHVLLHDGKTKPMPWLGFLCQAGMQAMPHGSFSKMEAKEVTAGNGDSGSEWIKLEPNQFVLCWRVLHRRHGADSWGVYSIVSDQYCPLIVNQNIPPPKKSADVIFLAGKNPSRFRTGSQ